MSKKHQRIYKLILEQQGRKAIEWDDFLNLLEYLGASIRTSGDSAHGNK